MSKGHHCPTRHFTGIFGSCCSYFSFLCHDNNPLPSTVKPIPQFGSYPYFCCPCLVQTPRGAPQATATASLLPTSLLLPFSLSVPDWSLKWCFEVNTQDEDPLRRLSDLTFANLPPSPYSSLWLPHQVPVTKKSLFSFTRSVLPSGPPLYTLAQGCLRCISWILQ